MKKELKTKDVMIKDVISVLSNVSMKDAAGIMVEKGISSLAIKEGADIVGIVTNRDFVKKSISFPEKRLKDIAVKELMSSPLTISQDSTLEEAARLMGEKKTRHLLVKEGKEIVGLVSLRDLLTGFPELIRTYSTFEACGVEMVGRTLLLGGAGTVWVGIICLGVFLMIIGTIATVLAYGGVVIGVPLIIIGTLMFCGGLIMLGMIFKALKGPL